MKNANILGMCRGKNCEVFTVILLALRECLAQSNTVNICPMIEPKKETGME